jgi:nicotinate phosphoribosyltransferase
LRVHTVQRERLAPDTFRLPLDKIRSGYYSDAYFNHSKALLEAEERHPRVLMQVFQRKESILGGSTRPVAILKLCSGRRARTGRGSTASTPSTSGRCTRATGSSRGRRS